VLHLVYLAGLFTFAVVLGIVTDDISTQVDKVRGQASACCCCCCWWLVQLPVAIYQLSGRSNKQQQER
jgi:hypothetical protein